MAKMGLKSGRPRKVQRRSAARGSQWDVAVQKAREWVDARRNHREPIRIASEMSYSNASSTASAIRKGKHGDDVGALFALEDGVEQIDRPDEHPEFRHYEVWVVFLDKYTGDDIADYEPS